MKLLYNEVSDTILDVKADKRHECFNFGKDNAFPSLIEILFNISVTSKTCADRAAKAVYGGTFGAKGDVIVNSKGESLNEVLRIASREYVKHNNAYLQIGYDGNLDYRSIVVLPVTSVRVGKSDDRGYSGKFIVYDNWDRSREKRIVKNDFIYIDRFSKNKKIVEKQLKKLDENVTAYHGQIIHIKKDTAFVYSLSDLSSVLSEALLEDNSQVFRSRGALEGFLNTKIIAVQPFKDDTARTEFVSELKSAKGVKNSSGAVLLESERTVDDLSKTFSIEDLSSEYNDKLFEYSDKQAEKNICKSMTVPLALVNPSDSSLFGNSGALLIEAKVQLYESRLEERNQLEEVFSYIMKGFSEPVTDLKILNPYEAKVEEKEEDDVNALAQATLRGSVGGVTSLLAIQQSVSNKTTTKEAGIAMIVNIYGFNETQADAMLGDPDLKE